MSDHPRPSAVEIFEAALDLDPAEQSAFVERAAAGDTALRDQVLALLAADSRAEDFLQSPPLMGEVFDEVAGTQDADHPDLGRVIDRHRLIEVLGRGGMGTVFRAERAEGDFEQQVAIKVIRRGMDTDDLLRRFEHERQLLARLDHPNIARLIDGGATDDGRPYLVMELIEGLPLDAHCRRSDVDLRGRIRLFLDVCTAVQHAHRNLVVHRDLKPGNIMVSEDGTVKLLDFGIAKIVEDDAADLGLTATNVRLLSPRYGSPEQMRGEPVTTASDVYSLGVILYELLAGQSPYADKAGPREDWAKHVLETEPTPPSTAVATTGAEPEGRTIDVAQLQRDLRGDLDTIVLKALRKEPERRYTSVDEFAEDLRRYLDGRPVLARPDSFRYRAGKFVRRNAAVVAALSFVALALVIATGVSTALYLRAERAQTLASRERHTAEQVSAFLQEMLGSINPEVAQGDDTTLLRRLLEESSDRIDTELQDNPQVAAELHHTLGKAWLDIGYLEEAGLHLERAVELWPDGPSSQLVDRGSFYYDSGRYDEALSALEEAVARAEERKDVVSAARGHYWWGMTLEARNDPTALGHFSEAEGALREAGADRERLTVLGSWGAYLVNNRQEFSAADSLYLVALELVDEIDAGPLAAGVLYQYLATSKRRQGELSQTDSLYTLAFEHYSEILEDDHPQIGSLQDEWAGALEQMERYDEAEPMYRDALESIRGTYGDSHRMTGTVLNNLANLLRKVGRNREAEPLFQEAVAAYRSALGEDHVWVGIILGNVAANEVALEEYAVALATSEECIRIRSLHWDADHWRIAAAEMNRGAALSGLGRYAEAEQSLLGVLEVIDAQFGADSSASAMVLGHLAPLYDRSGRAGPVTIQSRLESRG